MKDKFVDLQQLTIQKPHATLKMYEIKATKKRVLLWQIYREIPHRLRGDDLK